MNTTAAFAVDERTQVGEVRRAAAELTGRLGFDETRAGQVALVVTELATNLAAHARQGEILLHAVAESPPGDAVGIEILAIDSGPGMRDLAASRRDGYSTAGTPGHGLGTIERQTDYVQIYTLPSGTVTLARVWRNRPSHMTAAERFCVGAVHVSKPGEEVAGDEWAWRIEGGRIAIFIADGLGHGLAAHDAAAKAVAVFVREHTAAPLHIVKDVHGALASTRGAAVGALVLDGEGRTARYCGLGNVSAVLLAPSGQRRTLVSHNGTAGHTAPRLQEFEYPMAPGSVAVMHSDGVGTQWDLSAYPGILTRDPSITAGLLYRDFGRRLDDATVVVVREMTAG